jgi:hypothetical protein
MTEFYVCIQLAKEPTRLQVEALNITHGRFVTDMARKTGGTMVCPVVPASELPFVRHACRVELGSTGGLELVREEREADARTSESRALDALDEERRTVLLLQRTVERLEREREELSAKLPANVEGGASGSMEVRP